MCSNNFKATIVDIELFTNVESDNGWVVSCEEVFARDFEFPRLGLDEFFESFLEELGSAPVDHVEGRDGVVDEFKESLGEDSALLQDLALHLIDMIM